MRLRWFTCILLAVISVFYIQYTAIAKPAAWSGLQLREHERLWIKQHPTVRIAFDGYFPPYSFVDEFGQLNGLAVDMVKLLSERTGIRFVFGRRVKWAELYAAAQRRDVDVVATMVKRPEREQWFVFTHPYIFKSLVIMTRADDDAIRKREDIAGKTVALVKSYSYISKVLAEFPTIRPYDVDTMLDGLNAVTTGKADAAITFVGAGEYLQKKYLLSNLKFAAVYDRDHSHEGFGVRKDWPELVGILDKALASISEEEKLALVEKWVPSLERPADWGAIMRISALFLVLLGLLVVWLIYMRKQQQRLKRAKDEGVLANNELSRLREHLEQEVKQRTAALEQSRRELQQHHDHLEAEVRQRTQELSVRAEESETLNKGMLAMLEDLQIANQRYEQTDHELRKANDHLQSLDRMKSMFIASMSHELRTPMNSILGFSDLILDGMTGEINETQRDMLTRVKRSGQHLLMLITDVIDLSKVEAGKISARTSDFQLAEMLEGAVQDNRLAAEKKGLAIEVNLPDEPVVMFTDRHRLLQCVLNLISNAVKYSKQGTISLSARQQDEDVIIAVQDTGIGMSTDEVARLFKPFVRIDSELTIIAGGTGLGLYLTQKLMQEVLGGTVAVESQPGKGSCFTLRLPREHKRCQEPLSSADGEAD